MSVRLSAVVAIADNHVIGKDGTLPWRMSSDLKWFKTITWGKPIIMGRTTFDDLGKALPGRLNIVLTRGSVAPAEDVVIAGTPNDAVRVAQAVALADGMEEACVIGGAEVYRTLLPACDRIYLTRVHGSPDGDRHLELSREGWEVETLDAIEADDRNAFNATIEQWDRRRSA